MKTSGYWITAAALIGMTAVVAGAAEAAEPKPEGGERASQPGPLDEYVAKDDNSYGWTKKHTGTIGTVEYAELILTSQTWRDIAWKHQLFVINPSSAPAETKHALLLIAGGRWKDELAKPGPSKLPEEAQMFAALAERMKTPVAVLLQVPQQPMFGGKVEDEIIALTFERYMKTKDPEWPLLLPMAKSAVKGMDAVQEFAAKEWSFDLETFTVTGASKRGWTTWLTGAVDERVTAIAPIVIDVLNMKRHLDHQRTVWGGFSNRIHDYTERGLQERLSSEAGKALRDIVDPYSYRKRLKQPKLIIIGTNDRYWPLDAMSLYWNDLVGPKYALYVPNNGHGIRDFARVLGTLNALNQHARGELQLPQLDWKFGTDGKTATLTIDSDPAPEFVNVWSTTAGKRDFRDSRWTSARAEQNGDGYFYRLQIPETDYAAVFGEAVFPNGGFPYYLSTNVKIVEPAGDD